VAISAIEAVNIKAMRRQAADITDYVDPATKGKYYDLYWQTALYNDRVYALPFNTDTRFIYYNKKMFQQAGVNAADIKTWADLLAAGDKLDAALKGTDKYKLAFSPVIGNFGFDMVSYSNGGSTWDNEMNPSICMLNSPQNVEALEYMRTWGNRYGALAVQSFINNTGSGTEDPFISGQVAMFGHTCNYIATLERYGRDASGAWIIDYDTIPMPTGPSYKNGPKASGGGFVAVVPYGSKHPREATKLAEFMTWGEAANIWAVEQKDVMCSKEANEQPQLAGAVGWDRTLEMLAVTQISRRHIYAPDAIAVKDQQINRILHSFENVPAKTVLDEAVKQISAAIASEKAIFGVQ
jgi:multiple sugar transport system substrate-binding protein